MTLNNKNNPEIVEILRISRILFQQLKIIKKNGISDEDNDVLLLALINIKKQLDEVLQEKEPGV